MFAFIRLGFDSKH